jgi:hypothetical protein
MPTSTDGLPLTSTSSFNDAEKIQNFLSIGNSSHFAAQLTRRLRKLTTSPQQPQGLRGIHACYLTARDGGNLSSSLSGPNDLVQAVVTLYARMVAGNSMLTLSEEMTIGEGAYSNCFAMDCCVLIDGACFPGT